ncbi:D-isomer specific 2-hydroxyacid dehydrogenase [Xylogone sp. PMI_703]|nr:D-isomer specific 2-hydroxyacid dehydrogenase [Xylogone sp. PMI_703]
MATSKIRVAILDDYQGIAGAKFSHLASEIDLECFPNTLNPAIPAEKDALIKRLQPFTVISTMRERTALPGDVIRSLPNLRLLLTTGMKNSAIDITACTEQNIIVAGAKGIGKGGDANPPTSIDSTLQHCWALILGIARNVARDDKGVKEGHWEASFATGLSGKTLGLLGFGSLGARVASVGAYGFGMKIAAWSSNLTQEIANEKAKTCGLPEGTFKVTKSKEELLQVADVLSIHYVLSERSRDMLDAKELALLKPSALLINTSRAPLVNEDALLNVLKQGKIKGAAIDVYSVEPLLKESVWRTTPEVLLSPHMGYVEEGVMNRWYEDTATNLELWLNGKGLATRLN